MALADVFFTPSILITLAICLILISALGLFFIQKLNQQNHKINTMFDLVNTLAQEMNYLKGSGVIGDPASQAPFTQTPEEDDAIKQMQYDVNESLQSAGMMHNVSETDTGTHSVNMIDISDDDSDGSNVVEDSDDSDDDADDDEDDEDDEDESDSEPIDLGGIKMESIAITPSELPRLENVQNITSAQDLEIVDASNAEVHELVEQLSEHLSSVKNLDIVIDYKKASLPKLREVIQAKGIVEDASKMKKADILKLLEE